MRHFVSNTLLNKINEKECRLKQFISVIGVTPLIHGSGQDGPEVVPNFQKNSSLKCATTFEIDKVRQ